MNKKSIFFTIFALVILIATVFVIVYAVTGFKFGYYIGKVYTSANMPVANISVTDGRHVVKTDEKGCFKLNGYKKTHFITITVPAGYTTENYYIPVERDKHDGYDFVLEKSNIESGEAHSFLQISDTEIGENGVGDWIDYLKNTVKSENPAFLIHTGDICYEPGLKRHKRDMNTENMGVPVHYIIGNHDYVDGKYGEELFESIYGPVWYSFEVGNVHYVVTPFQVGGDYKSCYSKNDRWRWLENDLKNTDENMKVVMFNHTVPASDDYVISFDRKELDLKKHNLIAWCFGHYHYNYVKENNGVLNISTARPDCGGIDSSVSGARMVYIDKDGTVTTKMIYYDFDVNVNLSQLKNMAWSAELNGNILFCDTVIRNGKVFTATVDDDYPKNCGVYCLDENNGSVLWYFETVNSIKNNLIVENGVVVAQDCEGNVYCINSENGSLKWKTTVKLGNSLNTSTGIILNEGIVYAGCAAAVTALDISSGKKVWENIRNHGEASPAEFIITGDKLIVSSHWDALVALNKYTGKQIWKIKDEDIRFRSSTPCVVDDETLLVADSDAIMLVNSNVGKITLKVDLKDYNFSSSGHPVIFENLAYIPTANKGVVVFDLNSQKIINEIAVEKPLIYTAPYTSGNSLTVEPTIAVNDKGQIIFASSDGNLYVLSKRGEIQNKMFIGAPVFSSVACDESNVFVGDFTGRVICLNLT